MRYFIVLTMQCISYTFDENLMMLPLELKYIIWSFVSPHIKLFVTKEYYEENHKDIFSLFKLNPETYFRNIAKHN